MSSDYQTEKMASVSEIYDVTWEGKRKEEIYSSQVSPRLIYYRFPVFAGLLMVSLCTYCKHNCPPYRFTENRSQPVS